MDERIKRLINNVQKVIVGNTDVIEKVIACMLSNGHVLIEDVPGVGKTQLVASIAKSVSGKFNRVQLTPDIMPSDIVGFTMVHPETKKLTYRPGSAICNFLLADEINRASPKVQSSLLEVMEEHQISVDGQTLELPKPFMTLATQNPVETYGTYHLPEAQLDRFLMKLQMGYPNKEEELLILDQMGRENPLKTLAPALTKEDVLQMQQEVQEVSTHTLIKEYILNIVIKTRNDENIMLGASPRGTLALQKASKAVAFISGRDFVVPDDVIKIASSVLSHRIILSAKGKASCQTPEAAIQKILRETPPPIPNRPI
ncbi:MAG: MoxR family ATPase [Clostridiales bacterium]|jgi:MoxR-like ATPase|nr:MoxR family ATPase [Clostridiales bacterium]